MFYFGAVWDKDELIGVARECSGCRAEKKSQFLGHVLLC